MKDDDKKKTPAVLQTECMLVDLDTLLDDNEEPRDITTHQTLPSTQGIHRMTIQARVQSKLEQNKVKANITMTFHGEKLHLPHKKT